MEELETLADNDLDKKVEKIMKSGKLRLETLSRVVTCDNIKPGQLLELYKVLLELALALHQYPRHYISPEVRGTINKSLQLVLAHDPQLVANHCFALGENSHTKGWGTDFNSPARKKAVKYFLLAHRLKNSQASEKIKMYIDNVGIISKDEFIVKYHNAFKDNSESDIKTVCATDPNEFCRLLLEDFILTSQERDHWIQHLFSSHFLKLSPENKELLQPLVEKMDSPKAERSLLQTVKALFFSDSSDDEREMREFSIENSNLAPTDIGSTEMLERETYAHRSHGRKL